jgi:uncharacterized RmlC-like cupin family protein
MKDRWKYGVSVMRAGSLHGKGRATAFDFDGTGGTKTWIGVVTMEPGACTGAHDHGVHEVAFYVAKGRSEIRWGERLQYSADVGPGDFAYFMPQVPHQERNLSDHDTVEFVVVRSDGAGYVTELDVVPAEHPEAVF